MYGNAPEMTPVSYLLAACSTLTLVLHERGSIVSWALVMATSLSLVWVLCRSFKTEGIGSANLGHGSLMGHCMCSCRRKAGRSGSPKQEASYAAAEGEQP